MARIEVQPDIAAHIGRERLEAGAVIDRHARMHLEAHHNLGGFLRQPCAGGTPEGSDLVLHLPLKKPFVVGRSRPARKHTKAAATWAGGTAAHRDHAFDAKSYRPVDGC